MFLWAKIWFLASRLNVTKENSKNIICENFCFFGEVRGEGVEKGKRDLNVPKIIFLLIKTYFSEYLRSERSPAARRSTCIYILLVWYTAGDVMNKNKYPPRHRLIKLITQVNLMSTYWPLGHWPILGRHVLGTCTCCTPYTHCMMNERLSLNRLQ